MALARICLALLIVTATAGCQNAATAPKAEAVQEIAWREGDVADALAEAKESNKPVMLYWGAKWCPPCAQMKATLFKDPAFIAETRQFVPVYLDGDSQGAQRWGERFGISGYPTVILLRADGSEITRLSSGSTASRLADVLKLAAGRTTSTEALLAQAQSDPRALTADDWQLLAAYDWQNDPKHFGDHARAGALLAKLAAAAPDPALQRRFGLLALTIAAEPGPDGNYTLSPAQQASLTTILPPMLANAQEVTANRQELSYSTAPLVAALPDAAQRKALGGSLVAALDRVFEDDTLSLTDRLAAVRADVDLAKASDAPVPPAVLAKVRARAAWADKTAKDAMQRQSVISDAAFLLHEAGDTPGAKKLVEAELKRSASPYYYMLDLASLAEDSGDKAGAISWARKAYETSEGASTRVQWAIVYSSTVMRLTPEDKAAVEASAGAVVDELGKSPDSYYQRTRVKVAAWGGKFRAWSEAHGGSAVLDRLEARMAQVCARQGAEAKTCLNWARAA